MKDRCNDRNSKTSTSVLIGLAFATLIAAVLVLALFAGDTDSETDASLAGRDDSQDSGVAPPTILPPDTPALIASTTPSPRPSPTRRPTASPTPRSSCGSIRGTAYTSSAERSWFQQNCITPTSTPAPPAPTATLPPSFSSDGYILLGFTTDATQYPDEQEPDPPEGPLVPSGSVITTCSASTVDVYVRLTARDTGDFETTWLVRGQSQTNTFQRRQSTILAHSWIAFTTVAPSGTYLYQLRFQDALVVSAYVTLVC